MNEIWKFSSWLPDEIEPDLLAEHCDFANGDELLLAPLAIGKFASADFPVAQLRLTLEDFSVDCFSWQCFTLVSQKLRDAMALGPQDVQYLPVNASLSAPLPRSQNYMIMHVPAVEDVSDVNQSDYMGRNTPGDPNKWISVREIAIRQDAAPKHELFHDSFFRGYVLCTEALAVRVLQGRCTGVRFLDLKHFSIPEPIWLRTLQGIAEERWDHEQEKNAYEIDTSDPLISYKRRYKSPVAAAGPYARSARSLNRVKRSSKKSSMRVVAPWRCFSTITSARRWARSHFSSQVVCSLEPISGSRVFR
jgi:Immunity protein family (Imm11)